jgi:hypothetical protein
MATHEIMIQRFPKPIDHVYILCNAEKEPDRFAYLSQWLRDKHIDPTQVSIGMATYGTDPFFQSKDLWKVYDPWSTKHGRRIQNFNARNLKPGELSLVLNFAEVAKAAVAAKHEVVLILESDVIFCDEFFTALEGAFAVVPPGWDFLSLSASAGIRPTTTRPNQLWYSPNNPRHPTRATDSMIFRVPMLAKILETLFPFAEALDWELNFQLTLHGASCWWLDPPVTRQGSGVPGSGSIYLTTL